MTADSMTGNPGSLSPLAVAGIWSRHLVSLVFPGIALAFIWTGPHPWYIAPLFMLPLGFVYHLDIRSKVERRQPLENLPAWPFDAIVYVLAGLQLVIVFELARMFSHQTVFSLDMAMVFLFVGGNSGFSIITAHELIHRRSRGDQLLGRLLLCTVLYEHFFTEHLYGHHARVGTSDDPATARFGETYREFWRRTVPGQFKSAWKLEARRLGDEGMRLSDPRMRDNRIVHGLLVGWGIALAFFGLFGIAAFVAHLLQAFMAVRLLEAVNYFEHWGLRRTTRRVQPVDSWDTHSWFTYYGLTGLSRHADHHAYPARPFQKLRVWDDAPLLPVGYVGLVDMVLMRNDEFREIATAELERRRLGPFAEQPESKGAEPVPEPDITPSPLPATPTLLPASAARALGRLPQLPRIALAASTVILVATLGALVEGSTSGFLPLVARNTWIFLVFAGMVGIHQLVQARVQNEAISWMAAFAALVSVGSLTDKLLG